jgi:hypothetical protein
VCSSDLLGFEDLGRSFEKVIGELAQTRVEMENTSHFLNTILQHIENGLIAGCAAPVLLPSRLFTKHRKQ